MTGSTTGWAALGVLALCFLLNALARGAGETYAVFLLPIGRETGWDRADLTSVYSVYMLANGLASPFVGAAFDRFGGRALYVFGLLSLGGGFWLAGHMEQLWHLSVTVGIMGGLGIASLGMIPGSILISRWFDGRMGTAMAVASTGLGTGTLILAPLAQVMVDGFGWRGGYGMLGGAILLLALPVGLLPWRRITAGIVQRAPATTASGLPSEGLARAIRSRPFWALFCAFFFTAIGGYAVALQTVAYLVEHGFAPIEAAGAFGAAGMLSIVGMLVVGAAADRFGNRITVSVSYVSTLLGIVSLALVQVHPGFAFVVGFVIFFGGSMGARGPVISTLAATIFSGRGIGAIYGTITTGQGLGAAIGTWMAGFLHDATGGYTVGFVTSSAFILAAMVVFWVVPELATRRRMAKTPEETHS
ncbi:MFS transporter [Thalassobaculum sp. OXR-137]|uniref:MFS transporter n=1 Tax=Thalassobaculum sp. OXR-137 TaxID=3100173 RepID=UPI002AC96F32|nr:MFS transporter [Thalassobaculum sp. OXR-137]WPZ33364.1 MFS transporter [Thalassobaculum sp. OXR-137]